MCFKITFFHDFINDLKSKCNGKKDCTFYNEEMGGMVSKACQNALEGDFMRNSLSVNFR